MERGRLGDLPVANVPVVPIVPVVPLVPEKLVEGSGTMLCAIHLVG